MTDTTATGTSARAVGSESSEETARPEEAAPASEPAQVAADPPAVDEPAGYAGGSGDDQVRPDASAAESTEDGEPPAGGAAEARGGGGPASGVSALSWSGTANVSSPPMRPGFTRPPGMAPPPEQPDEHPLKPPDSGQGVPASAVLSATGASASGSFPVLTSAAPVSAPPRATGRAATGGVTVRPIGTTSGAATGTAVGAARVTEGVRPRPAATPRGPTRRC